MLRIGTRRSVLALWQANFVKERLLERWPELDVEIVTVVTKGDRVLDRPLASIGGKALFVKEIEDRLLAGEVDIAVHSMKDVPAELPDGLEIIGIMKREDPTDAFVARDPVATPSFDALPMRARVGTGSLRRACQLRALRPDIVITPMRGNVDTRLRKLDESDMHALVLASAALKRLGLSERITERMDPQRCLPAVGQGAMALEGRIDDARTHALVRDLHHRDTADCVIAERGFLSRLGGGCQVPIAGLARLDGEQMCLRALVGYPEGKGIVSVEKRMPRTMGHELGLEVASEILARGGARVLDAVRRGGTEVQ